MTQPPSILVLLTPLADPRAAAIRFEARQAAAPGLGDVRRVLGPFGESALEVALKIRDSVPAAAVGAILAGDGIDLALLRSVAALRLDRVLRDEAILQPWDPVHLAQHLRDVVLQLAPQPDIVLIGREFGDWDDGTAPACLADLLGWPYRAHIQGARLACQRIELLVEYEGTEDWTPLQTPMLASVTNDRRNRLRHPLMRNVAAARAAVFETIGAALGTSPAVVRIAGVEAKEHRPRGTGGQLFEAATPGALAAVAQYLRPWALRRE